MSGIEASIRIQMESAWGRKPAVKDWVDTFPIGMRPVAAMTKGAPPHQAARGLPTHMGKSQERKCLGFSLSTRLPVYGGEPPKSCVP
jgi:hypothetical protein